MNEHMKFTLTELCDTVLASTDDEKELLASKELRDLRMAAQRFNMVNRVIIVNMGLMKSILQEIEGSVLDIYLFDPPARFFSQFEVANIRDSVQKMKIASKDVKDDWTPIV